MTDTLKVILAVPLLAAGLYMLAVAMLAM